METEKENEVYEGEISVEEENSEQTEKKEEKTSAKRTKGVLRELFSWVMVEHAFNPSTWEAEAGEFLSWGLAWFTE